MSYLSYNTTGQTGNIALVANQSMPPIVFQNPTFCPLLTAVANSDQAGTAFIDQSLDGVDWDVSQSFAISIGDNSFETHLIAPWVRIRYTNGSTGQTYMRLFVRTLPTRTNK
jgi:hypothetical protein